MEKKVFENYSQYYDLLNENKNYSEETAYIISIIKLNSKNSKSILELGCGTGGHAEEFAKKSYSIHGIDLSDAMLLKAKSRQEKLSKPISEKISFSKGDIKKFTLNHKFDVVVSLFHVISYILTVSDLESVIKTAKKHLNTNGLFIFDCWHAPAVIHDKPVSRIKVAENNLISVKRTSFPTLLEHEKRVDIRFDIEIHDKKTDKTTFISEKHEMRYWYTEELKEAFNNYGFELIHKEEWLTRKPLSQNSWYASYVFKNNN